MLARLHRFLPDEEFHSEINIPVAQIVGAIFKLLCAGKERRRNRRIVIETGIGPAFGFDKEFRKTRKRYLAHDPGPLL